MTSSPRPQALAPGDARRLVLENAREDGIEAGLLLTITRGGNTWRVTDIPAGFEHGGEAWVFAEELGAIEYPAVQEDEERELEIMFAEGPGAGGPPPATDNGNWYDRLRGRMVGTNARLQLVLRLDDGSLSEPVAAERFTGERIWRAVETEGRSAATVAAFRSGLPKRTQQNTRYTDPASQALIDEDDEMFDHVADTVDPTWGRS